MGVTEVRAKGGADLPAWRRVAAFALKGASVAVVGPLVAVLMGFGAPPDGRIDAGVRIAHIDVSGLDRTAAAALLANSLPLPRRLLLTVPGADASIGVEMSALGYGYDIATAVERALSIGHSNQPIDRLVARITSLTGGVDLPLTLSHDHPALVAQVARVASQIDQLPVDAAVGITTAQPIARHAVDGRATDRAALTAALHDWLSVAPATAPTLPVAVRVVPPQVSDAEAQALADRIRSMTARPLTLILGGVKFTVAPAELSGWLAVSPSGDSVAVAVQPAAVRTTLARLSGVGTMPRDAVIVYSTERGLQVIASRDGLRVDAEVAADAAVRAIEARDRGVAVDEVAVPFERVPPGLDTGAAIAALPEIEALTAPLTVRVGAMSTSVDRARLLALFGFAADRGGNVLTRVDDERLAALTADLAAAVDRPGGQNRLAVVDGSVTVVGAPDGVALDRVAAAARLRTFLGSRTVTGAKEVTLPWRPYADPSGPSMAELVTRSRGMVMVSRWTTRYVPGITNFYGRNITVPTRKLDGYLLMPGDQFEFFSAVGPISRANGYGPGGAIIGGKPVNDGAMGGGICTTSTTLFNVVARAGLQINERHAHAYYINRYALGLDATVFRTDSSRKSLQFTNDTPNPILIHTTVQNRSITFELWSLPIDRKVAFSEPVVSDFDRATTVEQYTDTLPAGTSKYLIEPHDGQHVRVTRTVTDANGGLLWFDRWHSRYQRVDGVKLLGRDSDPPF